MTSAPYKTEACHEARGLLLDEFIEFVEVPHHRVRLQFLEVSLLKPA